MRDWKVIAIITSVIGLMGLAIYWDLKHPCLEWQNIQSTCGGGMTCIQTDTQGNCNAWMTQPTYSCVIQQCIRRKE